MTTMKAEKMLTRFKALTEDAVRIQMKGEPLTPRDIKKHYAICKERIELGNEIVKEMVK